MNFGTVLTYALLMLFMMAAGTALSQNLCGSDICVVQFNASWNESNSVVPTIVVFNGKEVERFQANIMMQMEATREEVQESVDEIIMSAF